MRLSEVPVVEVPNHDIIESYEGGIRTLVRDDRVHRYYDFGPSYRGHEEHVMFAEAELVCPDHLGEGFHADCERCQLTAAPTIAQIANPQGAYQIEVTAE